MRGIFRLAALAVCATFGPSIAQADEVSAYCSGATAPAGDARLCPVPRYLSFTSTGPDTAYSVRLLNPASACSDVSYILHRNRPLFRRDATTDRLATYRLRPGQGQSLPIGRGYAAGPSQIGLTAVHFQGDCQGRSAQSWRAFVAITPDTRS